MTWVRSLTTARVSFLLATVFAVVMPFGVSEAEIEKPRTQRVHLVMDSSGSMAEKIDGGKPRIDAAKDALHSLVDSTPDETELGLRVYGATHNAKGSKESCRDSNLVAPIGRDNRDDLRKAIDQYKPAGWTPISYALKQAGNDIGKPGDGEENTIVLVSDGEETCVPDPCPVVGELQKQGINVTINVVGMNVSGKARKQLQCIANKGNGQYFSAENPQEIQQAIADAAKRKGQKFELDGDKISGGDSSDNAAEIKPGTYVDEFDDGQERWYRVKKSAKNSTIWAGAAMMVAGTQTSSDVIEIEFRKPGSDDTCASETKTGGGDTPEGLVGVSANSNKCDDADELLMRVETKTRDGGVRPTRLHVEETPAVKNKDDLEGPSEEPVWQGMPNVGPSEQVQYGGASFANAKVLKPGSYSVGITFGETQVFAVDIDWGEHIQVQTDLDGSDKQNLIWYQKLYSPFATAAQVNDTDSWGFGNQRGLSLKSRTFPVNYNNNDADGSKRENSLPGRYYIIISAGERGSTDFKQSEAIGKMRIKLLGSPGSGKPEFADMDQKKNDSSQGEVRADGKEDSNSSSVADSQEDSGRNWMFIGIGAVVVILLLVALVGLTGRRDKNKQQQFPPQQFPRQ